MFKLYFSYKWLVFSRY